MLISIRMQIHAFVAAVLFRKDGYYVRNARKKYDIFRESWRKLTLFFSKIVAKFCPLLLAKVTKSPLLFGHDCFAFLLWSKKVTKSPLLFVDLATKNGLTMRVCWFFAHFPTFFSYLCKKLKNINYS